MSAPPGRPSANALLARSWVHVREADEAGLLAFRPEGSDLPPARGRDYLRFAAEGAYERRAPGPDDRLVARTGRWTLRGSRLSLDQQEGRSTHFEVVLVSDDRLLLRPRPEDADPVPGSQAQEQP